MKNNIVIIAVSVVATLLFVAVFLSLRSQIQTTKQQLANFPFEVHYRKAITGNGYVDQFLNKSDTSKSVKITLTNPTLNQSKVFSQVVDAHRFLEIGYLQGWASSSGDQIALECDGVVKQFTIP
jgi:hypothetical protein